MFAFDSKLSLKTVFDRLVVKLNSLPTTLYPDGVFVLERGAVLHERTPLSELRVMEFAGRTLMNFVQTLHGARKAVVRLRSPLISYFPNVPYTGRAMEHGFGLLKPGDYIGPWIWSELQRLVSVLLPTAKLAGAAGDEVIRLSNVISLCLSGEYPAEFFEVRNPSAAVTSELAASLSAFLRREGGKREDISPYPRADIPFTVRRQDGESEMSVAIRSAFIAGIQKWLMDNCVHFPTRNPSIPEDLGFPIAWPPVVGKRQG